jgi:iron(III) transport system substrate-binding protein
LVKEADAPKNWDDLLNPRWNGKLGLWVRAEGQGALSAVWGVDKTADYIKKLNANHPVLEKSTFTLAQQIAAGELLAGLGIYHTTRPALDKGAPIKVVIGDPAPVDMLYNIVPAKSQNPKGGELLALWFATPEGARAYEDATARGNPLIEGTKTEALLRGRTLAEYPPEKSAIEAATVERFNKLLESGATN